MIAPVGGSRDDKPVLPTLGEVKDGEIRWYGPGGSETLIIGRAVGPGARNGNGHPPLKGGQGRPPSKLRQTARDLALLLAGALLLFGAWMIAGRP